MPGFCVSCGAPISGAFCNKCGARAVPPSAPAQPTAPAPVQAPPVSQPVGAVTKSSGVGKVLLWIGGILLVLFIAGAAAAVYGVYWVKHKVANYASAVTGGSSDAIKVVKN